MILVILLFVFILVGCYFLLQDINYDKSDTIGAKSWHHTYESHLQQLMYLGNDFYYDGGKAIYYRNHGTLLKYKTLTDNRIILHLYGMYTHGPYKWTRDWIHCAFYADVNIEDSSEVVKWCRLRMHKKIWDFKYEGSLVRNPDYDAAADVVGSAFCACRNKYYFHNNEDEN